MNFAPYQAASPETNRALSPPPTEGRRSASPGVGRRSFSPGRARSPPLASPLYAPKPSLNPWAPIAGQSGNGYHDVEAGGRAGLNEFETSLPLRLDYEACLAYLLLPPAGGVLLLVLEHKSDYVRFHAWQSALLFSAIFVLHLIFSWSTWLSWLLLIGDLCLIGFLTMRAYRDADTLDRCEIPFFGRIASSVLDDE